MKARPKALYHLGTCLQCGGEGDVLMTLPAALSVPSARPAVIHGGRARREVALADPAELV